MGRGLGRGIGGLVIDVVGGGYRLQVESDRFGDGACIAAPHKNRYRYLVAIAGGYD